MTECVKRSSFFIIELRQRRRKAGAAKTGDKVGGLERGEGRRGVKEGGVWGVCW